MAKDNSTFFRSKNSWSEIKDRLLAHYLPQYFQKVLTTNRPIFYVDCFAGKGRFDDGKDGSPRIALKIRHDCISRSQARSIQIDTCFIDLNHAEELKANIADCCSIDSTPRVVSGKYEDEILKLMADKAGYNIFLYIDPYGIKALDFALFQSFATHTSIEMLINMNTFGFFRDACRVMSVSCESDEAFAGLDDIVEYEPTQFEVSRQSEVVLNGIAGGNYWMSIVRDYQAGKIDGYEAEREFSIQYKRRLNERYKYVLDMPIRMQPGHRPKFRMVHVCNHAAGCFLMASNMLKRKDELFLNLQNKGQLNFLSQDVENNFIDHESIRSKIQSCLTDSWIRITEFIARFFSTNGLICDMDQLYDILKDMEQNGEIEVTREPAHTKTDNVSTFWTESGGNKVWIRRCKS